MRRPAAILVLLGLLFAGCALPEGDRSSPEGLHFEVLMARQAGDAEAQWALLHPDVRALLERWHAADRQARREISLGYPSGQQEAALGHLGPADAEGAEDARALFVQRMARVDPEPLSLLQRLGARTRGVTVEGEDAVVRTLGGDEIPARLGADGQWYAVPRAEELTRMEAATEQAEANLERVKRNVAIFSGRRTGGAR